jgi:Ras-related C3 botulinum toxin substrate 1
MSKNVRIFILGQECVGKTCLLTRYMTRDFPIEFIPTTFESYNQKLKFENEDVDLVLWDAAGGEDYDKLRSFSYTDTDIFVLCYSVINSASLKELKVKFIPEIRHHCGEKFKFIIVGTKIDLRDDENILEKLKEKDLAPISYDEGLEFAKQNSAIST